MAKKPEEIKSAFAWEVRKNGEVFEHGSEETFPNAEKRKLIREGGYEIYLNGKVYGR